MPRQLGEVAAFGGSNVEPSVRSCFRFVSMELGREERRDEETKIGKKGGRTQSWASVLVLLCFRYLFQVLLAYSCFTMFC